MHDGKPIKLIFGCGYLGGQVASRWRDDGGEVHAVTRSLANAARLASAGFRPLVGDVLRPETLQDLPVAQTVLVAVGWDRRCGRPIGDVYVDGLRHVLDALPPGTGRVLYISSTGVYGQADGEWVDEDSPCLPRRAGGLACLAAERLLFAHRRGSQAVVLRLGGLYGPGRIPRRRELEAGRPLAAPERGYLNLIHVEDAARAVIVVEREAAPPAVYCVTDGNPVVRGEYYRCLAQLLGAPELDFGTAEGESVVGRRAEGGERTARPGIGIPGYGDGEQAEESGRTGRPGIGIPGYGEGGVDGRGDRPGIGIPGYGDGARERAGSSKRVSSRRFRETFSFVCRYPSYREGLAAIVAGERGASV